MGQDRDILILAWLARQPTGFAYADEIPLASKEGLASLEQRELIVRTPGRAPDNKDGYVITPAGKAFQQGD